jgi:hypothetical protein
MAGWRVAGSLASSIWVREEIGEVLPELSTATRGRRGSNTDATSIANHLDQQLTNSSKAPEGNDLELAGETIESNWDQVVDKYVCRSSSPGERS